MRIALITPTGGRPEAFALCEHWMSRQSRGWDQWIVVDDCEPRTECTLGQQVVVAPWVWRPGWNTQHANMLLALEHVDADAVLVIEDDDYYGPRYIELYADWLKSHAVVGCGCARYYNLALQLFTYCENTRHASLCETGFRMDEDIVRLFKKVTLMRPRFIDCIFWRRVCEARIPAKLYSHFGSCIGIKGLPGRGGIGMGHQENMPGAQHDEQFKELEKWIGLEDAAIFREVMNRVRA